jgi:NarL family two-component system response regulator YdfI
MVEPIRVLIADDHEVVRDGLRLLLEDEADFVVVGEAGDGAQAVRLTGELQPQVVLMDLRMPGLGGLEAIEQIRAQWPDVAVVILTTYNEDELMVRGLRAGARGYLLKDTKRQTLFDTLRTAARAKPCSSRRFSPAYWVKSPPPKNLRAPNYRSPTVSAKS